MKPLRTKVAPLGGSGAIAIPLTLAKMFEWAPGAVVRAKLMEGGGYFEKEVRELYGGRASGIIIPKDVLVAHDLAIGDEVDVPFYEWVTVKAKAWPNEGLLGQRKRATRERRTKAAAK